MSYIVSIDASTTNTGITVFKELKNSCSYKEHKLLSYPDKISYYKKKGLTKKEYAAIKHELAEKRVNFMIVEIYRFLKKYKPTEVIIEDIYAQTDINTMKLLGRIQGAVLGWALDNNALIVFKSPNAWRSEVGIPLSNGRAKEKRAALKEASKKMVKEIFGLTVTDDESDSVLIGLAHIKKKGLCIK